MAAASEADGKGVNILVADSIGIGGLSTLVLLNEVMRRAQLEEGLTEPLDIQEYFDVVAGVGTAGIAMAMIGRLEIPLEKATQDFGKLMNEVFSEGKWIGSATFKASTLERSIKEIIRETTGNENEPMIDSRPGAIKCRTMVFAMSKHNMNAGVPTIFRSYQALVNQPPECTLWEALRATSAHPDMFKSIEIGDRHVREPFVSGAMGCPNPIEHVLAEVKLLYPGRRVATIISIGGGRANTIHIPEPSPLQRIFPTNVIVAMRDIATDSERVAQKMAARFRGTNNVYFRLNVSQGMQNMQFGDCNRLGEVVAHARSYMNVEETNELINRAAKSLSERKGLIKTDHVDGQIQHAKGQDSFGVTQCPAPTSVYVERNKLIQQAIGYLTHHNTSRHIFVFLGLGGTGKTQLALQTVERTRDSWSDVIYVNATTKETTASMLKDVAVSRHIGNTYEDTLRWLGTYKKSWLLVFDNADDSSIELRDFFPQGFHGRILITTRSRDMAILATGPSSICNVSSAEPEEAMQLLLAVAQLEESTLSDAEKHASTALLKELGYLPLAVVQAGAYIRKTSCSLVQYREMYAKQPRTVLERYSQMPVKVDNYEKTVYITWTMSYNKLGDRARQMLWLMAYLQRDQIDPQIFRRATAGTCLDNIAIPLGNNEEQALEYVKGFLGFFLDSSGNWDSDAFLSILSEITSYSLIDFDRANQTYVMHVLVQNWVHTIIPHPSEMAVAHVAFLLSLSISHEGNTEDYAFRHSLTLHIIGVLERQELISTDCVQQFARVLDESGQYSEAAVLLLRVVEDRQQVLGEEHPETLLAKIYLAKTYFHQGLWSQAEVLETNVLETRRRALGEKHSDTLSAMASLAATYYVKGLWEQAATLQVQVLEARRMLGTEHPDTLSAMGNLALTYHSQGLLKKAEALEVQLLKLRRRLLGDDHPYTLMAMGNLANTYSSQGLLKEAETLGTQVLGARKRIFGHEHPDTLIAMANLADIYHSQRLWKQAEILQVQVLEGRKRLLGYGHPDTLSAMGNLAVTYYSQGLQKKAEALQVQVLEGERLALGNEHPETLRALGNLAYIYSGQGLLEQAETLQVQVLEITERLLGDKHPDTLRAMGNLSITHSRQGLWKKMERSFRRYKVLNLISFGFLLFLYVQGYLFA